MRLKKIYLFVLYIVCFPFLGKAREDQTYTVADPTTATIVQVMQAEGQFTLFLEYLDKAGLMDMLNPFPKTREYTVLAPTDGVFKSFIDCVGKFSLKEDYKSFMQYLVFSGIYQIKDFSLVSNLPITINGNRFASTIAGHIKFAINSMSLGNIIVIDCVPVNPDLVHKIPSLLQSHQYKNGVYCITAVD